MKPIIEVQELTKQYHIRRSQFWGKDQVVHAVNGVSFALQRGETFGLVGESGCGKSTTGQLIVQLVKQTSGKVLYNGEDVSSFSAKALKDWRKEVQIVFQDPYSSLNPKKTIEWILREPLDIHHIDRKENRQRRVIQVLEDVGLDASYLKRMPHELSGGQRQRIAIAAALILEPSFMVIDEGVSALDVSVQAQILNLLKQLQRQYELTYLFISHDLNVVQYFCDRIAVMYLGEIVEIVDVERMGRMPTHPYARALFSSIPQLDKEVVEKVVLKTELPSATDLPTGCTFHTRCPLATAQCKEEAPALLPIAEEHVVRCHRSKEVHHAHRLVV